MRVQLVCWLFHCILLKHLDSILYTYSEIDSLTMPFFLSFKYLFVFPENNKRMVGTY